MDQKKKKMNLDSTTVLQSCDSSAMSQSYDSSDSPARLVLPQVQLQLVRTVKLENECNAVCHYKGSIYCGLNMGRIDRIDSHGNHHKDFIKLTKTVISLAACNGRLYSLMYCDDVVSKLYVHELVAGSRSGSLLTCWDHPSVGGYWGNRIALTAAESQLAVGDWRGNQIVIYSLCGDVIRKVRLPLSLTLRHDVAMTACGADSVLISDRRAGKISQISLIDGRETPCLLNIDNPGGMTTLDYPEGRITLRNKERRLLLVAHTGDVSLRVSTAQINSMSGKCVSH